MRFSGFFLLIHLESRVPYFSFADLSAYFPREGILGYLADGPFIRALIVNDGIACYREILPLMNSPGFG